MAAASAPSSDRWLIYAASAVRSFGYGFLAVVLGLYLAARGMPTTTIGALFTAVLAGGALVTVVLSSLADNLGRRRVLMLSASLMAVGGLAFGLAEQPLLLAAGAVVGMLSPTGKEIGPFLSVEQAMLSEVVPDHERTAAFSAYNLASSLAVALGALVAGVPELLGLPGAAGYQLLVLAHAALAVVVLVLLTRLSPAVEAPTAGGGGSGLRFGVGRSRGTVAKLAGLFAVDAFAGGFVVQGLVALWFHLRYGVDAAGLGTIFFGANVLTAVSYMAAVPMARRVGLLNTMVFTHLPSNVLLLLVPFMPSVELAVATFLARHLLSQLDVPTRQSYTMAIVPADERSAAGGLLHVARSLAATAAPVLAGTTLAVPALGLPFLVGGGLKIVYDLAIYAVFRGVRPPEEEARALARRVGTRS